MNNLRVVYLLLVTLCLLETQSCQSEFIRPATASQTFGQFRFTLLPESLASEEQQTSTVKYVLQIQSAEPGKTFMETLQKQFPDDWKERLHQLQFQLSPQFTLQTAHQTYVCRLAHTEPMSLPNMGLMINLIFEVPVAAKKRKLVFYDTILTNTTIQFE